MQLGPRPWTITFNVYEDKYFFYIEFKDQKHLKLQISKMNLEYKYFNFDNLRPMWITQDIALLVRDFHSIIRSGKKIKSGWYTRTYK